MFTLLFVAFVYFAFAIITLFIDAISAAAGKRQSAVRIQTTARVFKARNQLRRSIFAAKTIQKYLRRHSARKQHQKTVVAVTKIQAEIRAHRARKDYRRQVAGFRRLQALARGASVRSILLPVKDADPLSCLLFVFRALFKCALATVGSWYAVVISTYQTSKAALEVYQAKKQQDFDFFLATVVSLLVAWAVSNHNTYYKTAFEEYLAKKQASRPNQKGTSTAVVQTMRQGRAVIFGRDHGPAVQQALQKSVANLLLPVGVFGPTGALASTARLVLGTTTTQEYAKRITQGLATDWVFKRHFRHVSQYVWAEKDAVSALCGGPSQCGERFVKTSEVEK